MTASRPEADSEYSRGHRIRRGDSEETELRWQRHFEAHRRTVLAVGLLGAALLLRAEFTPFPHVHAGGRAHLAHAVITGSHHAQALLAVGALAAGLAVEAWRSHGRVALQRSGRLVAVGIALLGDLPDAHAVGLVGTRASGLSTATSSPAIGRFLETGAGAVLILSGRRRHAASAGARRSPRRDSRPGASPTRSAS